MVERNKLITKYKEELKSLQYEPQDLEDTQAQNETMSAAIEESVNNLSRAMKPPTLGNDDLGYIINELSSRIKISDMNQMKIIVRRLSIQ